LLALDNIGGGGFVLFAFGEDAAVICLEWFGGIGEKDMVDIGEYEE